MKTKCEWLSPDTAPKNGEQILGDFGYGFAQIAAWSTYLEKWITVSVMAQGMINGTKDIWFETEHEVCGQLKKWRPMPAVLTGGD